MGATGDSLANTYLKTVLPQILSANGSSLSAVWAAQKEAKYGTETWREPPVDILTFAHEFLERRNLSTFHHDAMSAFAGDDPLIWSERFKAIGLCWGMSGGKNFTSEIIVAYTMYKLLLLVNPHRYFDLDPTSSIDILNISFVNERQAAEIFFDR